MENAIGLFSCRRPKCTLKGEKLFRNGYREQIIGGDAHGVLPALDGQQRRDAERPHHDPRGYRRQDCKGCICLLSPRVSSRPVLRLSCPFHGIPSRVRRAFLQPGLPGERRIEGDSVEIILLKARVGISAAIVLDAGYVAERRHDVVERKLMVRNASRLDFPGPAHL